MHRWRFAIAFGFITGTSRIAETRRGLPSTGDCYKTAIAVSVISSCPDQCKTSLGSRGGIVFALPSLEEIPG